MRILISTLFLFTVQALMAQSPYTPWRSEPFSAEKLKASQSSFDLSRFSISHSYTLSYESSSAGSISSGLYLSHINFNLSPDLLLFTDIGFQNIFHTQGQAYAYSNYGLEDHQAPEFIMPQLGLEYKPNDALTVVLQLVFNSMYMPYEQHYTDFPARRR